MVKWERFAIEQLMKKMDSNVIIKSIYDPENKIRGKLNVSSSDEIINDPNIDAIYVCTPNYLNKPLTIKALEAGKHVFCEKPPALNLKDVLEIQKIEKKNKLILMYGFNHRHHASISYMKEEINKKTLGRVLWMRGRYGKSVDESFYNNWRSKKKYSGGGILIDQGIHMLDLFLYLGGDFDKVHASVSNLYWNLDVEDNVFATLENSKTKLAASLHSTMTQWRHLFSLEIFLEKGCMVLNGLKTSSNTYGDETLTISKNRSIAPSAKWEEEKHVTYESDTSWTSEANEFINSIKKGNKVSRGNSDDAIKLMKVIDQIYTFKVKGSKMDDMNFIEDYFDRYRNSIFDNNIVNDVINLKNLIIDLKANNKKIIIAGNGGSAAMSSHVSVDFTKVGGVRTINFNEADLITCFANDYGYENWVSKALEFYGDDGDLVILISSSGTSKNIVNAAKNAKRLNMNVVTFSGFEEKQPIKKRRSNKLLGK